MVVTWWIVAFFAHCMCINTGYYAPNITQSYAIYLRSTLFSAYSFEGYRLDLVDEYFSGVYYTVTITSPTFVSMTTDNASIQIACQTKIALP